MASPHFRLQLFLPATAWLLVASSATGASQNYTIGSAVGDGVLGYAGDKGPALQVEIWALSGVALDGAGNILIADTGNCRIRKVSNGIITTVAGNGICSYSGDGIPATQAGLNFPRGVGG